MADIDVEAWKKLPPIPIPDHFMTAKDLREALVGIPDEVEILFRRVAPICGNVEYASHVSRSTYGFFGVEVPCLIIEPEDDEEETIENESSPFNNDDLPEEKIHADEQTAHDN